MFSGQRWYFWVMLLGMALVVSSLVVWSVDDAIAVDRGLVVRSVDEIRDAGVVYMPDWSQNGGMEVVLEIHNDTDFGIDIITPGRTYLVYGHETFSILLRGNIPLKYDFGERELYLYQGFVGWLDESRNKWIIEEDKVESRIAEERESFPWMFTLTGEEYHQHEYLLMLTKEMYITYVTPKSDSVTVIMRFVSSHGDFAHYAVAADSVNIKLVAEELTASLDARGAEKTWMRCTEEVQFFGDPLIGRRLEKVDAYMDRVIQKHPGLRITYYFDIDLPRHIVDAVEPDSLFWR